MSSGTRLRENQSPFGARRRVVIQAAILVAPFGAGRDDAREGPELAQVFKPPMVSHCIGAVKRTRTSTPVKELAPQASASTNSAMTAHGASRAGRERKARRLTNRSGD